MRLSKASLWASATLAWGSVAFAQPETHAEVPPEVTNPDEAAAQQSEQGVGDIVVTAQRREQSLQEVPLAISAVAAEQLQASGATDTTLLSSVAPGLQSITQRGALSPYLRGVGTQNTAAGEEGSIAMYVDGVYYPSPGANTLSLSNIERVEVLRGPQGTLFGRNATGGMIHIITRVPSHNSFAQMSLGYANFKTISGTFYGTTGLSEKIAMDLAVAFYNQNEGWGRNITTGEEVNIRKDFTVRSKLLLEASDNLTFLLSGDYSYINSDIGNTRTAALDSRSPGNIMIDGIGLPPTMTPFDTRSELRRRIHSANGGLALKIDLDLGDDTTLTSTTAYRKYHPIAFFDQDGTPLGPPLLLPGVNAARSPLVALLDERTRTFQEELLLNSTIGDLDLTAGLFFYDAVGKWDPIQLTSALFNTPFGGSRLRFSKQHTKSYAAFAQGTYHVTPSTGITVGARYTIDKRILSATDIGINGFTSDPTVALRAMPGDATDPVFKKLTWRLAVEQKFGEDVLAYASYSRGFKSGVFNLTSPNLPSVRPEQIDAYAVGLKSEWFDQQLRFNIEAFYYDYKDIQLSITAAGGTALLNAASSRMKGADFEIVVAPRLNTGNLRISASASILDAKYKDFPNTPLFVPPGQPIPAGATGCSTNTVGNRRCTIDASGFDMIIAPDFTANAAIDYELPISDSAKLGFNVSYYYNDGFTWHPDNRVREPSYNLLNAEVRYGDADDDWELKFWARNITKELYYASFSHAEYGDQPGAGPPRTYGVTGTFKFR